MRNMPPPPWPGQRQGVCIVEGGSIWDSGLTGSSMCHKPFETVHDLHRYLRGGFVADPNHYANISKFIAM